MTTSDKVAIPAISPLPPRRSIATRLQRWEWFLVVLILLVILINSNLSPFFLNVNNLFRTSSDFMELGLMMLPMVFIIITGNVDLSVASTLGMTASFMGWLFNQGVNIWLAAGAALLLGALAGLLNGYLITRLKFPRWWSPWVPMPFTAALLLSYWATRPRAAIPRPLCTWARGASRARRCLFRSCCSLCWR